MTGLFGCFSQDLDQKKIFDIVKNMGYTIREIKTSRSCFLCGLDIESATQGTTSQVEPGINIVICGEVYNSDIIDLKKEILTLYETGKMDRLKDLNGSFAAAIYDNKNDKITLINDRYGSIKLFYYYDEDHFYFSPKIQPLLKLGIKRSIRKDAVCDFFIFRYLLGDKTFFEDIFELPPASILEVTSCNMNLTRYWNYEYYGEFDKRSKEELIEELGRLWQKAVERRIKKNEKSIIQISGGLDSRAILAAILKCTPKEDIITYTYGEKENFDFEIGKIIAEKTGVSHLPLLPKKENFEKQYKISMDDIEGMIDATPYFAIQMNNCLSEFGNRIYSGHMGGEIMGPLIFSKIQYLKINSKRKFKQAKKILFDHHKLYDVKEITRLFNLTYINNQNFLASFEKSIEDISKISKRNLPNYYAGWLYTHESDKYTAFCNLRFKHLFKYSLPFLDNNLIDFMLKIPPKLRTNKRLYKSMLLKTFPELFKIPTKNSLGGKLDINKNLFFLKHIILSFKRRFNKLSIRLFRRNIFYDKTINFLDYDNLLRNNKEYQKYFMEKIEKLKMREYFDNKYIEEIWRLHMKGKKNYATLFGLLVTFELLLEDYIDNWN